MSAKIKILLRLLHSLGRRLLQEKHSGLPLVEKLTQSGFAWGEATTSFAQFFATLVRWKLQVL